MSDLDLRQLAVDRTHDQTTEDSRPQPIISRYVLPGLVIAGFLGLTVWAGRESLTTRHPITVTPVILSRADVQQSGTPLFQAAGWVEPRPTAIVVPALAEGVIEELLVVEGQEVKQGEPVARLIDVDAGIELRQAQNDLALRQAELAGAEAMERAARKRFATPVHLQAELAAAESNLIALETELAKLPFLIETAQAKTEFARKNYEGKQASGGGVATRLVQQAHSELVAAQAVLAEHQGRAPRLQRQVSALQQQRNALSKRLELLIDESREVADTVAKVKAAQAQVQRAEILIEKAKLRVDRMTVRATAAGRVLALLASPGTRVFGMRTGTEQAGNSVISLYQPSQLQVRADVRLEDVPRVRRGQPVEIKTASSDESIEGVVLSPTSRANIQKNTLEVKVAITSPPETIRPEMLVTATFIAPETPNENSPGESPQRLLVPRRLVESSGDGDFLWVAGGDGLARRQTVQLGRARTEELVEVVKGLVPTDKLITQGRDTLEVGDRIRITGEE